jgi:hypothetical protein
MSALSLLEELDQMQRQPTHPGLIEDIEQGHHFT